MENIVDFLKDLRELSDIENIEMQFKAAFFERTIKDSIEVNLNKIEEVINQQIEFYGQKPNNYSDYKEKMLGKYKEKLDNIYEEFELQFINIIDELAEIQANQKIAMVNWKKVEKLKNDVLNIDDEKEKNKKVSLYDKKIKSFKMKIKEYESMQQKCFEEMDKCSKNSVVEIEKLIAKKTSPIIIYKETNTFTKIIKSISNFFNGKRKLKMLVLDNSQIEFNQLDNETKIVINKIEENTINFIDQLLLNKDLIDEKAKKICEA